MIIVPEIQTIVILPPRTGSGSMKAALLEKYPDAFMLYRHMEADGVPHGYDRWRKVGICREPLSRLWSLYKFCQRGGGGSNYPDYWAHLTKSVDRSFEHWLLNNETAFTTGFDVTDGLKFWPQYSTRHPIPENRKSQFIYLRPDLGTEVIPYASPDMIWHKLGVELGHRNMTEPTPPPSSAAIDDHIQRFHSWDRENCFGA